MYDSPRFNANPQGLYDLIRTAEMVEAEGISSRWAIRQDGDEHEHEVSMSYLHIEERNNSIKVYVPHDKQKWDNCFLQALPRRLLSWMMAPSGSQETPADNFDAAAVNVVTIILSCEVSTIHDLLKANGVPEIEEVEEVEEEPLLVSKPPSPFATPARRGYPSGLSPWSAGTPSSSAITPEPLSSPENGDASYVSPLTDPGDYDLGGYGTVPSQERLSLASQGESQEKYKRLLESAVVLAGRMARRDYGLADVTAALGGLSLDDDDVFASPFSRHDIPTGSDRHRKIGAAGELFVCNNN